MINPHKIVQWQFELDGVTYRGSPGYWEELMGCSWEPMSPWNEEKPEAAFRAWRTAAEEDRRTWDAGDR